MNIIEKVQSGISNPEWDLYTKARYLYLKSCQYFTYDHRYYYGDIVLVRDLFNKKIDLENVIDNKVICGTWATQVYLPLLELIGVKGELIGNDTSHQFVEFIIEDRKIKADACGNSDLARVKFGNSTSSFYHNSKYLDHEEILNVDKKIGYFDTIYSGKVIQEAVSNLEEEFQDSINPSVLSYNDEYLIFKFYKIKEMLEEYPQLKQFSDCQFFISYLGNKIFDSYDESKISRIDLYDPGISDWNFSRLYQVQLTRNMLYFILTNTGCEYTFYKITESDAKNYKSNYQKSYVR